MMLALEAISQRFGASTVLEEVTCAAEEGDTWAVVGPNGAGKTTLIRIAAGLLEPDEGRVLLEGESIAGMSRRAIARSISVLRQAPPQTFGFSALEIVLMGFHARTGRFSLPSSDQRERALRAMEQLEIRPLADRPATVLSGGELQRVLMARTLVAETPIWLLDEPTAHLDYRHRVTLLEQAVEHAAEGGCVVAAMHDLSLVERFFEKVLVLHEGGVAARGPIEEALDAELLSEVYGVRMQRGTVGGEAVWIPARSAD